MGQSSTTRATEGRVARTPVVLVVEGELQLMTAAVISIPAPTLSSMDGWQEGRGPHSAVSAMSLTT